MISDAYTQSLVRENARMADGLAQIEDLATKLQTIVDEVEKEAGSIAATTASGMADILLRRIQRVREPRAAVLNARPVLIGLTLEGVRS